jgi:hypothetical protein
VRFRLFDGDKRLSTGSYRFDDLVMPLFNKRELARIADFTPTKHDAHFRESTEAECELQCELLEDHLQ